MGPRQMLPWPFLLLPASMQNSRMKLLPLFFFVILSMPVFSQMPKIEPGVSHDLAIWRAAHYSDVRYKLNLTLEKMSPVLKGTIEIRVKVSPIPFSLQTPSGETIQGKRPDLSVPSNYPMPPIILDWRRIAGHEPDSTINNVSINGTKLAFNSNAAQMELTPKGLPQYCTEENEHLIFRDGVAAGENVIKLDFTSPILTSGSAITRYFDKEDGSEYIYSLFVPSDASTAFPVFDQPDLKARFTLTVDTRGRDRPSDWKVISNSPGRIHLDSTWDTLWNFGETRPISTYIFAFAVGPWAEQSEPSAVEGGLTQPGSKSKVSSGNLQPPATAAGSDSAARPITHIYVRKSQAAKFQPHAAEVFRLTKEGIKYLEEYFDYKFPWPKYDLVLIPEFPFGGMEHAGATFLRETGVIFPSEPTANDYISRANLIFHETAHQWFGDTVTMRWFDDLWLKEGFAEFMAYKTLEHVMPQYNAWKAFYERNKQAAYLTDLTKGTTPIYQEITNLSAAKSAYGNIVYRKAPSFLRQAEFYLGPDKFQTAVRAFLKNHAFANGTWQDLVSEFEAASGQGLKDWGSSWVKQPGLPAIQSCGYVGGIERYALCQSSPTGTSGSWRQRVNVLIREANGKDSNKVVQLDERTKLSDKPEDNTPGHFESSPSYLYSSPPTFAVFEFPNYQDYGYGIFLLDDKSRDYVLKNIQNEKDDFLRSMMWGSLWDSVREAELNPRDYVELAIKNLPTEKDETITASVLGRVATAVNYYLSEKDLVSMAHPLEEMLISKMQTSPELGRRITYFRSFLNLAASMRGREVLKQVLSDKFWPKPQPLGGRVVVGESKAIPLKTKDRFDIVTRLAILNDPDAPKLLADLEAAEKSDDAKRYAYAAHAAFPTKENREKFWTDFVGNKDISESWIEAAMVPFNSPRNSELALPYLERALAELPNLKRNRKIFFVNGWRGAFIGGQKSQAAFDIVNKFLADNPNLDRDLRLKILENVDIIERAVKIRNKFGGSR